MRGRILIIYFTIASLIYAPLAEAQQKVNWASQELKAFVRDNTKAGGKPMTMKEFWEKNKKDLSPFWQGHLAPAVELQKDQKLPHMEVIDIKGPQGQDNARLQLNYNGRTISVEYFGYQDKFARINGTTITFQDFHGVTGMMKKLMRDPVFANESKALREKALKAPVIPTYEVFARMTARQRAEYFVNLRLLMEAANNVQAEAMKVSSNDSGSESPFVRFILEKAYAQKKGNRNDPAKWKGQECIVAGYVGKYVVEGGRMVCSHTSAVSKFANTVVDYKQAQQKNVSKTVYDNSCGAGNFRCNPFIYGYERGHGSMCIPLKSNEFQVATKTCDERSPLTKGNLVDNTRAMVETLLKQEGKNKDDYFKDGKVVSKEKYEELVGTVLADFNKFIDRGISTCRATEFVTDDGLNPDGIGEVNQPSACQVLLDRKMAFEKGMHEMREQIKDNPVPPPVPVPGKENGQPCDLQPPFKPGKGTWKDGKCVPNVIPPAAEEDPCKGMMKATDIFDKAGENKKGGCGTPTTAIADKLPDGPGGKKAEKSFWDEWKNVIIPVGIFVGLFALMKRWWKAGSGPGVIPGTDPASPPLPAPPPQPVPVTPSPPISPTPPPIVVPPGSSEGGGGTNNPGAGGQR